MKFLIIALVFFLISQIFVQNFCDKDLKDIQKEVYIEK